MVYKYKQSDGKTKKAKVANLPDNVFVFDDDINDEQNKVYLMSKIDYNYYIDRAYEKLLEFIPDEAW